MMLGISEVFLFCMMIGVLAYQRASLKIWMFSNGLFLVFAIRFSMLSFWSGIFLIGWVGMLSVFSMSSFRRRFISQPLLIFSYRFMPSLLSMEEVMTTSVVTWERELLSGNPCWKTLLNQPQPVLTQAEQAFLVGPVEQLCQMMEKGLIDPATDLPDSVWELLKKEGFFGLMLPQHYGGKEFSAYAYSEILLKISGLNPLLALMLMVPNILGPSLLLLHSGTEEQKKHYLPRLTIGEEIPCVALTTLESGLEINAISDYGVVCTKECETGECILGIRLSWNKHYVTLAPMATVIGAVFRLYDPDKLLGNKKEIGVTCALIPCSTQGITMECRYNALCSVLKNGPIQGKDVFIPFDWIIGGVEQAGKGQKALAKSATLAGDMSIPASMLGLSKMLCYVTGAYARINRQFGSPTPTGCCEGIAVLLASMAMDTYVSDAARTLVVNTLFQAENLLAASAIVKRRVTEWARNVIGRAMDIHGVPISCLGERGYITVCYQAIPLTMILERAHLVMHNPFILQPPYIHLHPVDPLNGVNQKSLQQQFILFDRILMHHLGWGICNMIRCLIMGFCSSLIVFKPDSRARRYFQHTTRFSTALALMVGIGKLCGPSQSKEQATVRLIDILSYLYLLSAVFKRYHDDGEPQKDWPMINLSCKTYLYLIQQSLEAWCTNFPVSSIGKLLKWVIFPLGKHFTQPSDQDYQQVAQLLLGPTESRSRLAQGLYLTQDGSNVIADMQDALLKTIAAEPIEAIIRQSKKEELIEGYTLLEQAQSALEKQVITVEQLDLFVQAIAAQKKVLVRSHSHEE